jgi:hypothetical protein
VSLVLTLGGSEIPRPCRVDASPGPIEPVEELNPGVLVPGNSSLEVTAASCWAHGRFEWLAVATGEPLLAAQLAAGSSPRQTGGSTRLR